MSRHLAISDPVAAVEPYDGGAHLPEGTPMLAREKWQAKTIAVLERVFEERCSQMKKHGDAMAHLPDGTGPDVEWLEPFVDKWNTDTSPSATDVQLDFRQNYEQRRATPGGEFGQLTRMHLVREELAEAFELDGDDPAFVDEIIQVAALCVQWAEYKTSLPTRGRDEERNHQ